MKCPNCGIELYDINKKYCPDCGSEINLSSSSQFIDKSEEKKISEFNNLIESYAREGEDIQDISPKDFPFSVKARNLAIYAFILPLVSAVFYVINLLQSAIYINAVSTNSTFKIFPITLFIAIGCHILAIICFYISFKYLIKAQKCEKKNRYEKKASVMIWTALSNIIGGFIGVGIMYVLFVIIYLN